jgi:hypothetical protein
VDNTRQEVLLTGLHYYTQYSITVAGFTMSDGNYSKPVYATTGEGGIQANIYMNQTTNLFTIQLKIFYK